MRLTPPLLLPATAALTAAFAMISGGVASAASTTSAIWNMSDTGSTMADASGNGHTGTLHGVTVRQPGVSGGYGYGFTGHPSYVSVPSATSLNPGTSNFSFTVNLKFSARPSGSVGDYDVLRKGLGSTDGGSYKVEVLENGKAFCDFRGSSAQLSVTGGPNLADGSWHSITCSRTSSKVTLTVGGSSYSTSGATGSISNTGSLYIGAKDGGGDDQYTGLLDKVSVTKG